MSREIRFRAWDKEKKVMLIIFDSTKQTEWFIPHWKDNLEVMQYTGLTDKGGKEIYEGALLSYKNSIESGIGEVFWDKDYLCFGINFKAFEDVTKLYYFQCKDEIEVIGNIYENNPESWKKGLK